MAKTGRMSQVEVSALVNEENKLRVLCSGKFCSKQELMRQMGIGDQSTFDRHFGDYYERSETFWKSQIAESLYQNLRIRNPQCTIFGSKTMLGLKEVSRTELTDADGKEFKVVIMDRVIEEDTE